MGAWTRSLTTPAATSSTSTRTEPDTTAMSQLASASHWTSPRRGTRGSPPAGGAGRQSPQHGR
jgi:hypothetical protein